VPADARFHLNDGDASRAKASAARSVRDREEELPASVLRTVDVRNVQGTLVGTPVFGDPGVVLRAAFKDGRVTELASVRGGDTLVERYRSDSGDKDRASELVISTNPALPAILEGGFMPYYGYGSGVVRIAIGDNWESGGPNRARLGETLFFLPDATLTANGVALVRDGKLLDR